MTKFLPYSTFIDTTAARKRDAARKVQIALHLKPPFCENDLAGGVVVNV